MWHDTALKSGSKYLLWFIKFSSFKFAPGFEDLNDELVFTSFYNDYVPGFSKFYRLEFHIDIELQAVMAFGLTIVIIIICYAFGVIVTQINRGIVRYPGVQLQSISFKVIC